MIQMTNSLIEKQIITKLQQLDAQQQQQVLNFTRFLVNNNPSDNFDLKNPLVTTNSYQNNGMILERIEGYAEQMNWY
jgi:mRNA-degrading endonuclease RelE of RelBE toxin-antitoxin system